MSYPKYPETFKKIITVGDKKMTVEIGKFTEQAAAAVLLTCGGTVVHTTVALGRKVNLGYFPLSVEYIEKLYSAGIIKGSRWVKRDGRPSDDTILKARVIDRSLRPLFPEGITNEVQVINTVFSYDGVNEPDMMALLGSALGVMISEIPFDGPLAGLRVAYRKEDQQFIFNPTEEEQDQSDLDLIVSGNGDAVVMVEAGANEVSEAVIVDGLEKAQQLLGQVCTDMLAIVKAVGKEKVDLVEIDEDHEAKIAKVAKLLQADYAAQVTTIIEKQGKLEVDDLSPNLIAEVLEKLNAKVTDETAKFTEAEVKEALYAATKQAGRDMILAGKRPDGRKTDEIRQIWTEVDVFPHTHGSAMFKRGATQAVTITTLGSPRLGQLIESIEGEEVRHYMHHYYMPPFASGEAGRIGWPKRREVGHGALAERALLPMIPSQEEFPYAIHVVSEIMSSNGSTSQASVCGSTLSLMAAGVPIKRPVAGIAMGLMSDGKKYVVLSDIQGLEDHIGDMDFKVAGSSEGITAIQMDIKLKGIPRDVLVQALDQAKAGRNHIMAEMMRAISEPRKELSPYAPKIEQITVPADKIGEIIGPSGKMIKSIIEQTGAEVDIEEDTEKHIGIVNISSPDQEAINKARNIISNMVRVVEVGEEFEGTVTRVESYGAFVEYLPGREGLVHVSEMSTDYVKDAADQVHLGDAVHVRIAGFKEDGKIQLSMLSAEEAAAARSNRSDKPTFRGGHDDGGQRNSGGGRYNQGGYRGDRSSDQRGSDRSSNRGGYRRDRSSYQEHRNDRGGNRDGSGNRDGGGRRG